MNDSPFPSPEYRLIDALKKYCNFTPDDRFPVGIGDDAVVRFCKEEKLIFTADTFVENVHFTFGFMDPKEVGYKAMAVNLSDCAAMGAIPDNALVQVVFPERDNRAVVEKTMLELYEGLHEACVRWRFPISGGNLSGGPCWILAISLTGRKEFTGRTLMRTGAQVGDFLWATGFPGLSAAGLAALKKWGRGTVPQEFAGLVEAHIRPKPQIEMGLTLSADPCVHAAIDISDGVAKECHTIAFENKVGIQVVPGADKVPQILETIAKTLHCSWEEWFLYGGEDYHLLFTADKYFNPTRYNDLVYLGEVTKHESGVCLVDSFGNQRIVERNGWDHLPSF